MAERRSVGTRPDVPSIDGRYSLAGVIGRGAMAEVRAGHDARLDREVAVKLLHAHLAAQEHLRDRFEEEARIAAGLNDPHVVATYDTGVHEGIPYIVMERLSGETLRDEMHDAPLPPARACAVVVQMLQALDVAHAAGVIHRDVKPENVLLTPTSAVKVGDFGIAKAADSTDLTLSGTILGTPAYLAPEVVSGARATVASDLYAVGIVLYEMLSGARPFTGETPLAVCHAIVEREPRALSDAAPATDPVLAAVVHRALSKDPADRYGSARGMMRALEADAPTLRLPATKPRSAPVPAPEPTIPIGSPTRVLATVDAPAAQPEPNRRGARRGVIGALAALVLAVGILGAIEYQREKPVTTVSPRPTAVTPAPTAATPLSRALDQLEAATRP